MTASNPMGRKNYDMSKELFPISSAEKPLKITQSETVRATTRMMHEKKIIAVVVMGG